MDNWLTVDVVEIGQDSLPAFCFRGHAGVRHATKGWSGKARRSPIRRPSSDRGSQPTSMLRGRPRITFRCGDPPQKKDQMRIPIGPNRFFMPNRPGGSDSFITRLCRLRWGASVARGPVRGLSTGPSPIFCLRESSGACSANPGSTPYADPQTGAA